MGYNYTYDIGSSSASGSIMTTILMVYSVCVVVGGLFALASYVLRGIGFYTIAKSRGDENAWLAFVPFARKYQQGQLAGEITLKNKSIQKTGVWFLGIPIAWGIVSYLAGMVMGISVIGKVIRYGVFSTYGSNAFDVGDIIEDMLGVIILYVIVTLAYNIIYKAFVVLVDEKILSSLTTGNMPLIHSIFSAFVPLYEAICFFVLSRRIAHERPERHVEYSGSLDYTMVQDDQRQGEYTVPVQTEEVVSETVEFAQTEEVVSEPVESENVMPEKETIVEEENQSI